MGQPKPACQSAQERLSNTREVYLGLTKKISADEARRCPQCAEPTCLKGCPLGVNIPGFIRFLRESDAASALRVIKAENPFPSICGRICPAPCESACVFNEEGSPIAIRALERYASDLGQVKSIKKREVSNFNGKKIAIVGSGPSAMAAASILLQKSFKVVMFEAANEPGGVLRYGIPEFRLPQNILNEEFDELVSQGLDLHINVMIGRTKPLEDLTREFEAVLLATGANLSDFEDIEGENLTGVYYAEEFLMRLQTSSKDNVLSSAIRLLRGYETVVVGSGYAALDAARMVRRLGQNVSLIFGGLEEELGIPQEDLKDALDEGIKILAPYEPLRMIGNNQHFVSGVECRRLEIVEGKGRLELEVTHEPHVIVEAQTVILANGGKVNSFLAQMVPQLKTNVDETLYADEKTSMTSLDQVFVVAGAAKGPLSVVESLADGKRVAKQIIEYLK